MEELAAKDLPKGRELMMMMRGLYIYDGKCSAARQLRDDTSGDTPVSSKLGK